MISRSRPCRSSARRRGGRLQPRQFGQGRDAGRARFHRADDVEGRPRPTSRRSANQRRQILQRACSRGRRPRTSTITATYTTTGGSTGGDHRHGNVPTSSWASSASTRSRSAVRPPPSGATRLRVALVLDNTGSMADRRQDRRAEDGDRKPADQLRARPRMTATSTSRSCRSART